jgi:hypothetical protein
MLKKIITKNKKIKRLVFKTNAIFYTLFFPALNMIGNCFARITSSIFRIVMFLEWYRKSAPEWMDHDQDLYFQMPHLGKSHFLERGVLTKIAISDLIPNKKKYIF